ncbi:hydrogenobyrinic acid a,c-diamide synthase (glutamine-hydrolysing) [Desulfocapsa sulfexigens DSM 10523]|uniref:Cobyrinate a,c-diamide synthase n=1 Tax=Desulfocapsa sulfexigens (strain DSM 10523 / SB164P1) TaxID=1167006 RepID=M1PHU8_DESSD|nr:cobyrinate a,c-diamide synthase [Desulfocapsa sulfexigens]AGF79175.1 hydrogenobyrinic acid a,c-diamide synthase (glutamine-hydrolysing) [Desulfocapsa sulfexigens DSM 10523]
MTKGIVVAGLAGGSGKSVVSVGLTAALARQGKFVVPFKKGPDYIDAGWMKLAAGRNCYNLDPYLMSEESIKASLLCHSEGADLVVLEGNRGLFDGVNVDGGYSTAELALSLNLPILLVVNCTKTTRTVAAMVLGCMKLDERVDIRGVVLNQIGTKRHQSIVTQAVEKYTGLPVLGAIPRMKYDIFPMRHLGVTPHQEYEGSEEAMQLLAETAAEHLDLERIQEVMEPIGCRKTVVPAHPPENKLRIGLLMDAAFQFYYSENLEALEQEGAELIAIDAMVEDVLPELDGLYIGGGFPETSAGALAANTSFRDSIKTAAETGLPIYAECGGLIYLGESIELEGEVYPLAGVFPVRFGMSQKPQAHGYSIFTVEGENPFYEKGSEIKGHEFRYSTIIDWPGDSDDLPLKMTRGVGFSKGREGLVMNNVLALYTHIHALGTPEWARGFMRRCREVKEEGLRE